MEVSKNIIEYPTLEAVEEVEPHILQKQLRAAFPKQQAALTAKLDTRAPIRILQRRYTRSSYNNHWVIIGFIETSKSNSVSNIFNFLGYFRWSSVQLSCNEPLFFIRQGIV
jgi:hypothetical protein